MRLFMIIMYIKMSKFCNFKMKKSGCLKNKGCEHKSSNVMIKTTPQLFNEFLIQNLNNKQ